VLNIGAGGSFRSDAFGLSLFSDAGPGTMNMTSGSYLAPRFVNDTGTLTVNAGVTSLIEANAIDFNPSSMNTINDGLRLQGVARVFAGASIGGTGALIVNNGASLNLENGALVGVRVINQGTTAVGFSTGIARALAFTQLPAGTLDVEIDGEFVGTKYDQLQVIGAAMLDGSLDVMINQNGGMYADPVVAGTVDEFRILIAASVSGRFSNVTYDGTLLALSFSGGGMDRYHVGGGLFRVVDYDPTQVDFLNYRALLGDANGDGTVGGLDFDIWNNNKFTLGTYWATGDFSGDGRTDGVDFGLWNSHKGASVPLGILPDSTGGLGGLSAEVVPEPNCLTWFVAFLLLGRTLRLRNVRLAGR
jgi:hypothetical protein